MQIRYLLLGLLAVIGSSRPAAPATITVDAGRGLVSVNPMLFGTNLHANDQSGEPIKAFVRDIGLKLYRYPDGGGYYYLLEARPCES